MGETVQSLVAQSGGGAGGLLGMLPFLIGMFAIMYFLMIRPERKRQTEHANMLAALKKGDEVVLTSGFVARIIAVEEKTLQLEIADKVRVRALKQSVSGPSARFLNAAADPKALGKSEAADEAIPADKSSSAKPSSEKASTEKKGEKKSA